ncbi:MAG: branched-chain amino acid ABC transporter permease [Gemmatimonadetes bacterium]|nr:branched-chain amino acid ABC transporter permease [Gemmatimonadota bacterium]
MKKAAFWIAALAVLGGLQLFVRDIVGAYNYQILVLVGINIILAVSLNLINGYTGQFSIGHAGFYAVGAYTCAGVVVYGQEAIRGATGFLPELGQNTVLLLVGLLCAAIAAGLAGLAVGIPSLRLRGDYLAIVTLGFGEIIRVLILNVEAVGGARGFSGIPQLSNFFWVYLGVVVTVVTVHNLVQSSYGRAFISIRDDEIAAEAMGVDTTRFKVLSFVVSSIFAGIAGGLFAHFTMYLHPNTFLFTTSFYLIIMIVVGGLGSIEGAITGAILVTVLLEVFREFGAFRLVNFAILLVLIMIYRPTGLLGSWTLVRAGRRPGRAA